MSDVLGGASPTKIVCCYIGPNQGGQCLSDAEFEIYELGTDLESRPGDNFTHACRQHAGEMMAHLGNPLPGEHVRFLVVPA